MCKPAKVVVPLVLQRVLCSFRNDPKRTLLQGQRMLLKRVALAQQLY